MADQWFYSNAGSNERHGPVSTAELRAMAGDGRLVSEDMLWREGMQAWTSAGSAKGLFPQDTGTPPLPSQEVGPPPLPQESGSPHVPAKTPKASAAERGSPTRGRAGRRAAEAPKQKHTLLYVGGGVVALVVVIVIVVGLQGGGGSPSGGASGRRRARSSGGRSMPQALKGVMDPKEWAAGQQSATQMQQRTQAFKDFFRRKGTSFLGMDPEKMDPMAFPEAERPMIRAAIEHARMLRKREEGLGRRAGFGTFGEGGLSEAPTRAKAPREPIEGANARAAALPKKPYTGLAPDPVGPPPPTTRTVPPSPAEPVVSEEQRTAAAIAENERLAIAALRAYAQAQEKFHEQDRYGVGDEMCANPLKGRGFPDLRSVRGRALNLIEEVFARATSPENAWNRYYFVDITHWANGKPHKWTSTFGLCAVPAEYGRTGVRTFTINQLPLLRAKDNGGKPVTRFLWGGEGWRVL